MACSICGGNGHNSRNCPDNPDNTVRNRAFIVRIDNLTRKEQNKLTDRIVKEKRKIAPDARGTIVSGDAKDLLYQNTKQLKPEED